MIAVIGATGNTGRATVKELKALGESPLCIVRNADKAREVLGADAKVAIAEITDRPGLEKASCECYSVIKERFTAFLRPPPHAVQEDTPGRN